jgi:phage shock protein PspC (stress-responsive transcriptional regulator)
MVDMATQDSEPPSGGCERSHLKRPVEGRLVAGVAAGLARQFDVDVTLVRLLAAAACLFGGLGIPMYLDGWLLIPDEGTGISIADDLTDHARARRAVRN